MGDAQRFFLKPGAQFRGLAAGLFLVGLCMGLAAWGATHLHLHGRPGAIAWMSAFALPLPGLLFLAILIKGSRAALRHSAALTVEPAGLGFAGLGLIPWADVVSVEVTSHPDRRTGVMKDFLRFEVNNLPTYARRRSLAERAFAWPQDYSRWFFLSGNHLDTPLPDILAAIEAHRPKLPPAEAT